MVRGSDILLCLVGVVPIVLDDPVLISVRSQVAILFPPAAVAFLTGCSCDLLINILLTRMPPTPYCSVQCD